MRVQGFQDIINIWGYLYQLKEDKIALEDIVFTNIDFTSQLEDKFIIKHIDIDDVVFYDRYRKLTFIMKKIGPKCFGQSYYSINTMEGDCYESRD